MNVDVTILGLEKLDGFDAVYESVMSGDHDSIPKAIGHTVGGEQ